MDRRLLKPDTSDLVASQFDFDSTSQMNENMKNLVVETTKDFRAMFPTLPKIKKLTDFQDGHKALGYAHNSSVISFNTTLQAWAKNPQDMGWTISQLFDTQDIRYVQSTVYHELGHALDYHIDDLIEKGILPVDVAYQKEMTMRGLIEKWQKGEVTGLGYPLSTYSKNVQDGIAEAFTESLNAYIYNRYEYLDQDTVDLFDFLIKELQ